MARVSGSRILVSLQKAGELSTGKAQFTQCILDYFGSREETVRVSCHLKDDTVIISDNEEDGLLLKHPSFCPMHCLKEDDHKRISEDTLRRGIDVGVATLLCTSDRKLLLTRRASHLRTFPGVWVPPGGHIELGETLVQAGLRELTEETGLEIDDEECQAQTIAMWESVYPAMLSAGLPRRHHVVVYQTIHSPHSHLTLQEKLKLQVSEVGAAAWLDEEVIRVLVTQPTSSSEVVNLPEGVPQTFRATVIDPKTSEACMQELDSSVLFNTMPSVGNDIERISTGTMFALQQWCQINPKIR
ncbi:nucleoside diphosphate-linked moiety X motif 17-like [Amphiura filiformis]|uniref:nucleoside diphosphate-linked moiety X motif 17-like n=1 Tax=Amphiura filiformis TaxID=82378 RepID=UPI003B213B25